MERNRTIDIAKGIGIMLVVYTHTKCYAHDSIYIFIMPLFFALSGYFFNKKRTLLENIKNKFNTLIIPYIFYFFLLQTFNLGIHKFFYKDAYFDWTMFYKPWGIVGPMWFFWGLFWTSVIFTFSAKLFRKNYLIGIFSLLIGLFGYFLSIKGIKIPLYIDSAISMVPFYGFGYLIKGNDLLEKIKGYKAVILNIICFIVYSLGIVFSIVNNTKPNEIPENYLLFIISSASAIILILFLSKQLAKIRFASNVFSLYGKESLIIFVWHFFAFYIYYLLFDTSFKRLTYFDGFLITIFALIFSMIFGLIQQKYLPIPSIRGIFKYLKEKLSYIVS